MEEKKGTEHVWCGALLGSIGGVQQLRWGTEGIRISMAKSNEISSISAYSSRLLVPPQALPGLPEVRQGGLPAYTSRLLED